MDEIKNVFFTKTAKAQYAVMLGAWAGYFAGQVPLPAAVLATIQGAVAIGMRRVTDGKATFSGNE